ncbi:MAG: transglutaminase domain-containing protein, partial [Methanobrevibacter sp.]|nr:transglutaminase domain-containing protein [Methanobrevibacter sp.]
ATTLKSYYASNNKFPSTVTAGGVKFTVPEFLYLMSQAIYQLGSSNTTDIAYITGVSAASSPSGDVINSNLYKDDYLNVSYNVANFIKANKIAPNYASSSLGNINYTELVDAFARVVAFYGSNDNMLPNYVAIKTSGSSSSSIGSTGSGLNEKCTITDLTAYLESSTNCQVNNSAIKSIVDSLTSGLTSDYDKAQAIFNYVRDTISYSFYYDTRYGAVGTLNAKTGNCVDHSHLLIAMYRTAGLAARYVHGTCTFSSGSTYGHVWTQVLIDGNWIVGDATSSRNSFGNVVNWNTNYYSLHGMYSGISF